MPHGLADLQALLAAAPALQVLEASVACDCPNARRLLRNEPPFGPLRMYHMTVVRGLSGADFRAMVAELSSHRSLTELEVRVDIDDVDEAPLSTDDLGLVVDAALTAQFKTLQLSNCGLTPAAAPALARLLSSPALTHLQVKNDAFYDTFLDAPGYALLGDALRVNRTLCRLTLSGVIWLDVANEIPALFGALTGHASLRCLDFSDSRLGHAAQGHLVGADLEAATAIFGLAIGMLVAADASALEELRISFHESGTDVFGPLADALPRNTHLRELKLRHSNLGAAFTEQRLLPAVRDNTSLRRLRVVNVWGADDALAEAVQLVDLREAARVAAEAAAAAEDACVSSARALAETAPQRR